MDVPAARLARRLPTGSVGSAVAALLLLVVAGCVPTTAPGPSGDGPAAPTVAHATVAAERVASGLDLPVSIRDLGDGSGRLLVVEQRGRILLLDPRTGEVQAEPVLDLAEEVSCCGEQGLLDVAPHPQLLDSSWVFVSFTARDGATTIGRFELERPSDDVRLDPATRQVIIAVPQPGRTHNGGGLAFGPDDNLFVGVGDGHFAIVPRRSARRLDTLLGSLLRLDVSRLPYRVPDDNPLRDVPGALPEIWAYGLRNPWRIAIDAETDRLFVADVGQASSEEVNVVSLSVSAAPDFGWPAMEGLSCRVRCDDGPIGTMPVLTYDHRAGCSVTGGAVYRGAALPELVGRYLYGDFCRGTI